MSIFDDLQEYDVIIMSGIPGSGKSTIAKHFSDRAKCSADDHFGNPYIFVPSEIGEAHKECMANFISRVIEKNLGVFSDQIIVDNTNIEAWEISPYVSVAEARGLKVCVLQINCPEDIAAARNTHGVPTRTINRMANRLANRHLPPFWKVITVDNV